MPAIRRHAERGMTLVELMVGLVIGLFIVSTALALGLHQLQDSRRVQQESRLGIELQGIADKVVDDLRRAGYRRDAGVAIARAGSDAPADPYAAIDWFPTDFTVQLAFARDDRDGAAVDSTERFRFGLQGGVFKMEIGGNGMQPITDPDVLTVTAFKLTPVVEDLPLGAFCEHPCPAADLSCPRQQVRRYDLFLEARSATDATITRRLTTSVRVRNDLVAGACPA